MAGFLVDPSTFVSIKWVNPLLKMLKNIRGQREKDVLALADVFGDPRVMLSYYVVPNCQHHNPADHDEYSGPLCQDSLLPNLRW